MRDPRPQTATYPAFVECPGGVFKALHTATRQEIIRYMEDANTPIGVARALRHYLDNRPIAELR